MYKATIGTTAPSLEGVEEVDVRDLPRETPGDDVFVRGERRCGLTSISPETEELFLQRFLVG